MADYINKLELSRLVREAQTEGVITLSLYQAVAIITTGVNKRYPSLRQEEDLVQLVALAIAKNLMNIDPDRNVFSYITATVLNETRNYIRKERNRRKAMDDYAREIGGQLRYWTRI